MTLSQVIKLRTDGGGDIVDFLVDVMHDRYKDFRICHRLQAARLLTTYGNEDAPYFIAENPTEPSPRRDRPNSSRRTWFDTELARIVREDTDDGRSIVRFLVNVMVGELTSFRPHHRMAAARELLDRGFGKSAHTEQPPLTPNSSPLTPKPAPVRPEPAKGPNPDTSHPLTPHSSPLTPQEANGLSTDILDTLVHLQPERFEQTVLDLLEGIGYGRGHHLGGTGDGGIDGIIDRDALGIDRIYVQAKRWKKPVGEPEIRNFSGSLDPHGATRGLLITTSHFTGTARRTAETISAGNKNIRLVDGRELAQLMISLNMGATTRHPPTFPKPGQKPPHPPHLTHRTSINRPPPLPEGEGWSLPRT